LVHDVPDIGSARTAAVVISTDGVLAWVVADGRTIAAAMRSIAPVAIQSRQRGPATGVALGAGWAPVGRVGLAWRLVGWAIDSSGVVDASARRSGQPEAADRVGTR
jgi:hypothetical protein